MKKVSCLLFVILTLTLGLNANADAQTLSVWSVDVHSKIFSDAEPGAEKQLTLSAASNEYESAQFGIRSDVELKDLEITSSSLICEESNATLDATNVRIRRIGTLPVTKNTPDIGDLAVRQAPCDMPDILYDENVVSLSPNYSQGVWTTVFVPKGTPAGQYTGSITIKNADVQEELPVVLTVFPFELPDVRSMYMTNWWSPGNIATHHNVKYLSEDYWKLLDAYIKDMGDHRQNVLIVNWTPGGGYVTATRKEDGTWSFDFSLFERLLQIAEKYGVAERIELHHIGGIDRNNHTIAYNSVTAYDEKLKENVSVPIDEWLEPSLKALCDYLRKTNRFERAMLHIADEPYLPDIEAWRVASERVRKIEPDLKQIDAIETVNFSNRLDVWVPKLSHFDRWRKAFEARRNDGEFWYYICCHPVGIHYPNRFMDLPGARIRVLHWINYAEDLVGYLHWGYNYWQGDAFGAPTESYGPGDTHIVYPGPNGPLDSIRWELERESVEDFEYMKLLEKSVDKIKSEFDPELVWAFDAKSRSKEIARQIVPNLVQTTCDAAKIEQARQVLADEIVAATSSPRLVVQTFPEDGAEVFSGPSLVELYGLTSPNATVTINDTEIAVSPEGFFKQLYYPQKGSLDLTIVATLDGKSVKTTRRFEIK